MHSNFPCSLRINILFLQKSKPAPCFSQQLFNKKVLLSHQHRKTWTLNILFMVFISSQIQEKCLSILYSIACLGNQYRVIFDCIVLAITLLDRTLCASHTAATLYHIKKGIWLQKIMLHNHGIELSSSWSALSKINGRFPA